MWENRNVARKAFPFQWRDCGICTGRSRSIDRPMTRTKAASARGARSPPLMPPPPKGFVRKDATAAGHVHATPSSGVLPTPVNMLDDIEQLLVCCMESVMADPEATLEMIDQAVSDAHTTLANAASDAQAELTYSPLAQSPAVDTVDAISPPGQPLALVKLKLHGALEPRPQWSPPATTAVAPSVQPRPRWWDATTSVGSWTDRTWMPASWYERRVPKPVERLSPHHYAEKAYAHQKTQHVSFRDPIADVWPIAGRVRGRFSNNDDDEEEDDDDNMPLAKRKRVLAALQGQLASGPP